MKKLIKHLIYCTILICNISFAGTQVLGFEINQSTLNDVKQKLSKQTAVVDKGINQYSEGGMLWTKGNIYSIEGLSGVLYIFDKQNKLAAVIMSIDKERFDSIYKTISTKYKVVSKERPFVGDAYAKFNAPDTVIEINAPHLSFIMDVSYTRKDLLEKFKVQSNAEAAQKKKKESENF